MWGLFIFAPLFATYFQEPVGNVLSTIPFVGRCLPARHLVSVFWRRA
jgi:ABC-type phosphate transport system permease subunit